MVQVVACAVSFDGDHYGPITLDTQERKFNFFGYYFLCDAATISGLTHLKAIPNQGETMVSL